LTPLALGLIAALARDPDVRACALDAGESASTYLTKAFKYKNVTLRTGEAMTVAIAQTGCLAHNASARVLIYERSSDAYKLVLDEYSLPEEVDAGSDGTVTLATHESMDTIFEATYVWNGSKYAFSPGRSDLYDVGLQERRPYQMRVSFAPGTSSTVLNGSVALNFPADYVFKASTGQKVTVELLAHTGNISTADLWFGEKEIDTSDSTNWTVTLPNTGEFHLIVGGGTESDETRKSHYTIRLTIH
jgi:hypothetical protein